MSLALVAMNAFHVGSALASTAGLEQDDARGPVTQAYGTDEIIVTARKRDESAMQAPVLLQSVTETQVKNLKISTIQDLASVTPNLMVGNPFVSVGTAIYLRGLGNGETAQFIDQSVLLNIDGISMSHGAFYRVGTFDVAQIDVLKGPQALYFGKSSSAGIVAVRTADPTDTWEAVGSVGYEFKGDEWQLQSHVSGPISDTLGVRLAGYYNHRKGWLYNINPAANDERLPGGEEYGGRLTLRYDDDSGLIVRLKAAGLYINDNVASSGLNQGGCVGATRQRHGDGVFFDNCIVDNITGGDPAPLPYDPNIDYSPANPDGLLQGTPSPLFRDGDDYAFSKAAQGALLVEYPISDGLTVTSSTGFSWVKAQQASNQPYIPNAGPIAGGLEIAGKYSQKDYTQELRLSSDWQDSIINFMVAGLLNRTTADNEVVVIFPAFTFASDGSARFKTRYNSAFGQVTLTPDEHWELSAGVRYSDIKRYFTSLVYTSNFGDLPGSGEQVDNVPYADRSIHEDNWSPEVTAIYRPIPTVTIFLSYKQGYKGPGFNNDLAAVAYGPDVLESFAGEKARGFEGGVKARLFDRQLSLIAALYNYKYLGQQVSFVAPDLSQPITSNGADARVKGVEATVTYRPQSIPNLSLNGFLNYNHANYTSFTNAPCFGNQSEAAGCVDGAQDLSGHRLHRAPRWVGQFGFDYSASITSDYYLAVSGNSNFSSSYNVTPEFNPTGVQDSYWTFDASLRLGHEKGPWEIALIGRNLTNKYVLSAGLDNGPVLDGVIADSALYVYRPRQIMLQLTLRN